jgi:hypothetical protein
VQVKLRICKTIILPVVLHGRETLVEKVAEENISTQDRWSGRRLEKSAHLKAA